MVQLLNFTMKDVVSTVKNLALVSWLLILKNILPAKLYQVIKVTAESLNGKLSNPLFKLSVIAIIYYG